MREPPLDIYGQREKESESNINNNWPTTSKLNSRWEKALCVVPANFGRAQTLTFVKLQTAPMTPNWMFRVGRHK